MAKNQKIIRGEAHYVPAELGSIDRAKTSVNGFCSSITIMLDVGYLYGFS